MSDRTEQKKSSNKGAGWRPGYFIQGLVFFNGIILAFAAYFALNNYVIGIVAHENEVERGALLDIVGEGIDDMEYAINIISETLGLTVAEGEETISSHYQRAIPELELFDEVLWVRQNGTDNVDVMEIKSISASDRSGGSGAVVATLTRQYLQHFIFSGRTYDPGKLTMITQLPDELLFQEGSDPQMNIRRVAVVRPVSGASWNGGLVVGVFRLSRFINNRNLENISLGNALEIKETKSGMRILWYGDIEKNISRIGKNVIYAERSFDLGDANLKIRSVLEIPGRYYFLQRSPYMVLVFGIILTLAGTYYVRSSQGQSYKLMTMNKALALKNYELNSEAAERERLYQILREAEKENRAIINSVNDVIFETDAQGDIQFLNNAWRNITGFEIDQGVGRNIFNMFHPQDQEDQRARFKELIDGDNLSFRTFARLRAVDGNFRAVEIAVSVLRQDSNRDIRIVGTITDVEERRRAERALTEAEKKYRTIVEYAASGIYQMTPDGQFISANPAMARILGYESSEDIVRNIKDAHQEIYVDGDERARNIRMLESTGEIWNVESQVLQKDGTVIWISESARAVKDEDGHMIYLEGTVTDITKRKEAEIKMHDAKIQSDLSSRAKSEFLANMSHELRTPLNAIIGFSEIIKNEALGKIEQTQYTDYAADIYAGGKRLLRLINEILDVSRIEAGERQLNESVVDIKDMMDEVMVLLSTKVEEADLEIINSIDEAAPKVIGEELAIKQIFMNLMSNALKFTPDGGRVTMAYELDDDGGLRVSITDTGRGLDKDEIEKALAPFGQIETSMGRSNSGVGLGLTLVDFLIRLHDGRLELFSEKGMGTTATIIFPARRVEKADGKTEEEDGFQGEERDIASEGYANLHSGSSEIQ